MQATRNHSILCPFLSYTLVTHNGGALAVNVSAVCNEPEPLGKKKKKKKQRKKLRGEYQ
jgi:hypothetical protein